MADLDRYDLDSTYLGECECGDDLYEDVIHDCPLKDGRAEQVKPPQSDFVKHLKDTLVAGARAVAEQVRP